MLFLKMSDLGNMTDDLGPSTVVTDKVLKFEQTVDWGTVDQLNCERCMFDPSNLN